MVMVFIDDGYGFLWMMVMTFMDEGYAIQMALSTINSQSSINHSTKVMIFFNTDSACMAEIKYPDRLGDPFGLC